MTTFHLGQRVWRWVWTGGEHYNNVEVCIVRINRLSITIRYDDGHAVRVQPAELTPQ